jgi:hypothetical protein
MHFITQELRGTEQETVFLDIMAKFMKGGAEARSDMMLDGFEVGILNTNRTIRHTTYVFVLTHSIYKYKYLCS